MQPSTGLTDNRRFNRHYSAIAAHASVRSANQTDKIIEKSRNLSVLLGATTAMSIIGTVLFPPAAAAASLFAPALIALEAKRTLAPLGRKNDPDRANPPTVLEVDDMGLSVLPTEIKDVILEHLIMRKVVTKSVVTHKGRPGVYYCLNLYSDLKGALDASVEFQNLNKATKNFITGCFEYGKTVAPVVRTITKLENDIADAIETNDAKKKVDSRKALKAFCKHMSPQLLSLHKNILALEAKIPSTQDQVATSPS